MSFRIPDNIPPLPPPSRRSKDDEQRDMEGDANMFQQMLGQGFSGTSTDELWQSQSPTLNIPAPSGTAEPNKAAALIADQTRLLLANLVQQMRASITDELRKASAGDASSLTTAIRNLLTGSDPSNSGEPDDAAGTAFDHFDAMAVSSPESSATSALHGWAQQLSKIPPEAIDSSSRELLTEALSLLDNTAASVETEFSNGVPSFDFSSPPPAPSATDSGNSQILNPDLSKVSTSATNAAIGDKVAQLKDDATSTQGSEAQKMIALQTAQLLGQLLQGVRSELGQAGSTAAMGNSVDIRSALGGLIASLGGSGHSSAPALSPSSPNASQFSVDAPSSAAANALYQSASVQPRAGTPVSQAASRVSGADSVGNIAELAKQIASINPGTLNDESMKVLGQLAQLLNIPTTPGATPESSGSASPLPIPTNADAPVQTGMPATPASAQSGIAPSPSNIPAPSPPQTPDVPAAPASFGPSASSTTPASASPTKPSTGAPLTGLQAAATPDPSGQTMQNPAARATPSATGTIPTVQPTVPAGPTVQTTESPDTAATTPADSRVGSTATPVQPNPASANASAVESVPTPEPSTSQPTSAPAGQTAQSASTAGAAAAPSIQEPAQVALESTPGTTPATTPGATHAGTASSGTVSPATKPAPGVAGSTPAPAGPATPDVASTSSPSAAMATPQPAQGGSSKPAGDRVTSSSVAEATSAAAAPDTKDIAPAASSAAASSAAASSAAASSGAVPAGVVGAKAAPSTGVANPPNVADVETKSDTGTQVIRSEASLGSNPPTPATARGPITKDSVENDSTRQSLESAAASISGNSAAVVPSAPPQKADAPLPSAKQDNSALANVLRLISTNVMGLMTMGKEQTSFQLRSDVLPGVTVQLTLNPQGLSVTFTTTNPDSARLLAQSRGALESSLRTLRSSVSVEIEDASAPEESEESREPGQAGASRSETGAVQSRGGADAS